MTFCHATFGPMTMVSKLEVLSISTYKIVTIVNPLELISQRLMIRFDLTTKNHITDVWQSKILNFSLEANYDRRTEKATYRDTSFRAAQNTTKQISTPNISSAKINLELKFWGPSKFYPKNFG